MNSVEQWNTHDQDRDPDVADDDVSSLVTAHEQGKEAFLCLSCVVMA